MKVVLVSFAVPSTIGVFLATYNGADHCEDQISSLLWQRDVNVHVYVRDDGSDDDTTEIVKILAEANPGKISIINNGGIRTGAACGNFLALLKNVNFSKHDYIAFADQDDIWMPDKLIHAIDCMRSNQADGYSSDLICFDPGKNSAWMLHKAGNHAHLDYLFQGASAGCTYVLTSKAAVLCRDTIENAGSLCPGASHDWIIYAICRSHGLAWFRDPTSRILYRQHSSNQYGARRGLSDVIAKYRLTRSGWYRDHILWLHNVISGHVDERRVLAAIGRAGLADRWWLFRQARHFRRTPRSVRHLRAAILTGAI